MIRKRIADALRHVDLDGFRRWGEQVTYDVEFKALRLARRLDPPPVYPEGDMPENDLDFASFDAEVLRPMQDAINAATERMLARMDPYPIEFEIPHAFVDWHDPAPRTVGLTEETLAKIDEAFGQPAPSLDMTSFTEAVKRVDFTPFEQTDLRPYLDQVDSFVRDLARQQHDRREAVMEEWLEDVGTVVPGFGTDAVREILRRRDEIMRHPLAGGEIAGAGE